VSSRPIISVVGQLFEVAGVLALVLGALIAGASFLRKVWRKPAERSVAYSTLRTGLGRALLIGLELLIAADIIQTIAIAPTVQNIAMLGLIVLIRTFLSWSLEVEINGRWPWQGMGAPRAASGTSNGPGSAV
jgi:uncharacterized membrane protein